MIKHTLSFHIDNSQEDWICVHTPIPDYQMAYHINKAMPVHLKRRGEDFSAKDNGERYPIFSYQNKKKGVHWHLISNKMKSSSIPNFLRRNGYRRGKETRRRKVST